MQRGSATDEGVTIEDIEMFFKMVEEYGEERAVEWAETMMARKKGAHLRPVKNREDEDF